MLRLTLAAVVALLGLLASSAHAATTNLTASPADGQGWALAASGTGATSAFGTGPAPAPAGTGSVRLTVGSDGNAAGQMRHTGYAGELLSNLTEFKYSTWNKNTGGASERTPLVVLSVDLNGDGATDDFWFFEPAYQSGSFAAAAGTPDQGAVAPETWQDWDAAAGAWYTTNRLNGAGPGLEVQALATLVAAAPNARIAAPSTGGLRIAAGFADPYWENFEGNVDDVTVAFGASGKRYDFEIDRDADGDNDTADNCPFDSNGDQLNTDGDSQGDVCDSDDDGDTVADGSDNCPVDANTDQADVDSDGSGNACDSSDDRPKPKPTTRKPPVRPGTGGQRPTTPPVDPPLAPCARPLLRERLPNGVWNGTDGDDHIVGGRRTDKINGLGGNDCLDGRGGSDRLTGGQGDDQLSGGAGNDRLTGGAGRNGYVAGSGNDRVNSRNGVRERVNCGSGRDLAVADRRDRLVGCERVTRR